MREAPKEPQLAATRWARLGKIYILQMQGGQPIIICIFWHENLWKCLIIELFPFKWITPPTYFTYELDWSKVFVEWIKHGIFLCITSFHCYNLKIPRVICAHFFSCIIAHLSSFKILWSNPILISKLVHENSTANIGWNALKTTLSWA